ncbi:MAG: hypothetical protein VYA34_10570 [Myxococcota bacterium]|nr:hypothetical protein [Myxococcota bacterium]
MKFRGVPTSGIFGHGGGAGGFASGVLGVSAFLGMDTGAGLAMGLLELQPHSNKDTATTVAIRDGEQA